MNKIWSYIIIFCFFYSLLTGNFSDLVNSLFDVPYESIRILISIGSLIVIYNGIFQIGIDSKMIKKVSFLFKPFIRIIFNGVSDDVIDLLCADFTANLLGFSGATTPLALNIIDKLDDKNKMQNIKKLICMNISCFTLFPVSIITLRNQYGGTNNFLFWIMMIIITFVTFVFSMFVCKYGEKK